MSDIKGKYMKILDELEANIKNKEDLAIAKEKFMELTVVFMDIVDRLTFLTDERIKNIEEKQVEINNTKVEQEIDIPKGQHTLTVVLVDVNNKTIMKEQEVKGITRPTISLSVDDVNNPQNFVIKASDEVELDAVTFIINEDESSKFIVRAEGKKELEFTFPLEDGENRIIVTAYNIDGATVEAKGKATK